MDTRLLFLEHCKSLHYVKFTKGKHCQPLGIPRDMDASVDMSRAEDSPSSWSFPYKPEKFIRNSHLLTLTDFTFNLHIIYLRPLCLIYNQTNIFYIAPTARYSQNFSECVTYWLTDGQTEALLEVLEPLEQDWQ